MDNWLFVFVIAFIGSFCVIYGLGAIVGDVDFVYLLLFIIQFSFFTTILFQILHKLKRLEKEVEK